MQATATKTRGQELALTLRRHFRIGTRTRRYRNGIDLHEVILEALANATHYPGYYTGETHRVFTSAWAVYCSYRKHVDGYRIDGRLRYKISLMSAWAFTALLGEMVDAGVETVGDGERFFAEMARQH